MAVFGTLPVVRSQLARSAAFDLAFAYVAKALTPGSAEFSRIGAVPEGKTERVELGLGVFALEQAYAAKAPETGKWEAHEKYIDVQVIVSGHEAMRLIDVSELTLTEDYRAERDLMFFAAKDGGSTLRAGAGAVAIFYPADGHMPSLADGASVLVRKTVVKVPVSGAAA